MTTKQQNYSHVPRQDQEDFKRLFIGSNENLVEKTNFTKKKLYLTCSICSNQNKNIPFLFAFLLL